MAIGSTMSHQLTQTHYLQNSFVKFQTFSCFPDGIPVTVEDPLPVTVEDPPPVTMVAAAGHHTEQPT